MKTAIVPYKAPRGPKKQAQNQKKKPPTPKAPIQKKNLQQIYKPSHCAMLYAACLIDPFHAVEGACIPAELFPLPSQKVKRTVKGTFQVGANGIGFVVVDPSLTNDTPVTMQTTASSVGSNVALLNSFTNLQFQVMDLPFSNAQLLPTSGPGIQGRIVAVGIRARYVGPFMGRRGSATLFEDPDHRDITSLSYQTTTSNQQAETVDVTSWTRPSNVEDPWMCSVNMSGPVRPSDIDFSTAEHPMTGGGTSKPFMGVVVYGAVGDEWQYEVVEHVEYIGTFATSRTPSHADPVAFSKVLEASKSITAVGPLNSDKSRPFFERLAEGFREVLPILMDGANFVKSAITMDIGGVLTSGATLLTGNKRFSPVPALGWKA